MDRLQELVRLHRMGTGAREVARLLAMSPNTERAYRSALAAEGVLDGAVDDLPALDVLKAAVERRLPTMPPPQMVSSVQDWESRIVELAERGLEPQAIYDRLRVEESGFGGSYYSVRGAWRRWRKQRGVRADDVVIPVETSAGDVAQVDFGYVGRIYDAVSGRLRAERQLHLPIALPRLICNLKHLVASSDLLSPADAAGQGRHDVDGQCAGTRRVGEGDPRPLPGGLVGGEAPDPGRVRGAHGLSPQARDPRPAFHGGPRGGEGAACAGLRRRRA
jgi:hypothetical protein